MNRSLAIAAALSIAAPVASQPLPGPIQATVVRVVDGDTLVVDAAVWPKIVVNGNQAVAKGLKSQWIANTKQTAHNLLKPTDWLILRALVNPLNPVPLVVSQYRSAVTNRSSAIETLIQSRQTHDEFVAMFEPQTDADGAPIGNQPIHNWPENTIQEYER